MVFKAPLRGVMKGVFHPPMLSDAGGDTPVYSPELQAAVDYANSNVITLPPQNELVALDAFIGVLKSSGAWDTYDVAYMGAVTSKDFAFINLKDPSKHYMTEVNNPTFQPKVGFNGKNGSYRTNYSFALDAVNANLNSCTLAAYVSGDDFSGGLGEITYQEGEGGTIASLNTSGTSIPQYFAPKLFSTYANPSSWSPSTPNSVGFGLRAVSRTDSSSSQSFYVAGGGTTNFTTTATRVHVTLPDENIPLMGGPGGSTGDGRLTVAFYSIGGNSHSLCPTIQSAMLTYINDIGPPPEPEPPTFIAEYNVMSGVNGAGTVVGYANATPDFYGSIDTNVFQSQTLRGMGQNINNMTISFSTTGNTVSALNGKTLWIDGAPIGTINAVYFPISPFITACTVSYTDQLFFEDFPTHVGIQ